MRLIVFVLSFTILFLSCKENKDTQQHTTFSLDNILKKKIDLTSLEVSTLVYPDSILFGTITGVKIYEEGIFLIDERISRSILHFDFEGNFIFHFSKFGEGSDQYKAISDFYIENEEIFVAERAYNKIKVFDFHNFDLIREIEYHSMVNLIERINENANFILTDSYDDKPFEFIEVWNTNYEKKLFGHHTDYPLVIEANYHYMFKNFGDTLYYVEPFTNMFYQITNKMMTPVFQLDFEKYEFPEKFWRSDNIVKIEEELYSKEYKFNLHNIAKNDNCFSFLYYHTPFYKNLLVIDNGKIYEYPKFYRQLNFDENQQTSTFKNNYFIISYGNEMPTELFNLVEFKQREQQNIFYLTKFNPFKNEKQ
jgi:hypothetical protein